MATAAVPWIFITLYYMFVMLPSVYWGDAEAWKENLLLSRFAAPDLGGYPLHDAGGAAPQIELDVPQDPGAAGDFRRPGHHPVLMIPLQIAMIGLQWQMFVVVAIVTLLLVAGWRKLGHYDLRQDWKSILLYAVVVFALTQGLYALTASLFGESGGIHIEVLLPAFVLGMTMRHRHVDSAAEARASSFVSFLFMFLVGVGMPLFIGVQHAEALSGHHSVTGSRP